MDVVSRSGMAAGRVHAGHIASAMGNLRMTTGAGILGFERVTRVAITAAQAGMHPQQAAIVARTRLMGRTRGMALIAVADPRITGNLDRIAALMNAGLREVAQSKEGLFAPIVKAGSRHPRDG